jgi:hypothetical protein
MEELVRYDPNLIVGILGGSAGTTYDAFKLLAEAKKYGARVALFGRKINNAENQLAFVHCLRLIADGQVGPDEAVRAYHGVLQRLGVKPHRPLEKDLELQTAVTSYGGDGITRSFPVKPEATPGKKNSPCGCDCGGTCSTKAGANGHAANGPASNGTPDFTKMTPAQKIAWSKARWDRILG